MVIPLSDIQTLVGIDDHNKQTVILSDELNTLRRATNATIIRAGQQQQQQQQPNRQQPIVGQQQINQMGQQNRPNMGQIPQQQPGMFHSQPGGVIIINHSHLCPSFYGYPNIKINPNITT